MNKFLTNQKYERKTSEILESRRKRKLNEDTGSSAQLSRSDHVNTGKIVKLFKKSVKDLDKLQFNDEKIKSEVEGLMETMKSLLSVSETLDTMAGEIMRSSSNESKNPDQEHKDILARIDILTNKNLETSKRLKKLLANPNDSGRLSSRVIK